MSVLVNPLANVYASGVKLVIGQEIPISDDDFRVLSRMKKVEAVERAKAEAKPAPKKRGPKPKGGAE